MKIIKKLLISTVSGHAIAGYCWVLLGPGGSLLGTAGSLVGPGGSLVGPWWVLVGP